MRIFNAKILDEVLEGDGASAFPSLPWGYLLPRAEALKFTCFVDDVSNSPSLVITMSNSLASLNYVGDSKTLLSVGPLSSGGTFSGTYSSADAESPPGRFIWLEVDLFGADAKAHVRLWVCGRGPQALETTAATPSFAAQYEAARRLEDEDRLASRKRVTRAGMSQAFSPDIFLASLTWDR